MTSGIDRIMDDLYSFEYYFLSWIGDLELTEERMDAMVELIRYRREDEFEEDVEYFQTIRMTTLQRLASPFVQAFLEIMQNKREELQESFKYIQEMMIFLRDKEFMDDYYPGVELAYKLIQAHAALVGLVSGPTATTIHWNDEFINLNSKAQSILLLCRYIFNESIPQRKSWSADDLKMVIDLDPTYWVYHYLLCNRLRFRRRQQSWGEQGTLTQFSIYSSGPWTEELQAIIIAKELVLLHTPDSPNYILMCEAAICQALAEIVRANDIARKETNLDIGEVRFSTTAEVLEYVNTCANDALANIHCGFQEFIRFGEIYGFILPKQYRDYERALPFLRIAQLLDPDNSKANHKMGAIIISKGGDMQRAIEFFQRAVTIEPLNLPAWSNLFPAILKDFDNNEKTYELILALTSDHKFKENFPPLQLSYMTFYLGCLDFVSGNKSGAIEKWMEALAQGYHGFSLLQLNRTKFKWPPTLLSYDSIIEAIDNYHSEGLDQELLEQLSKLRAIFIQLQAEAPRLETLNIEDDQRQRSRRFNPCNRDESNGTSPSSSFTTRSSGFKSDGGNWRSGGDRTHGFESRGNSRGYARHRNQSVSDLDPDWRRNLK